MGLLAWMVFGLIVGVVAKSLMPGRDPGGFFVMSLLGIAGPVVGGLLGRLGGQTCYRIWISRNETDPTSVDWTISATVGAND